MTVDLATKDVREYLYPLSDPQESKVAVSEITALGPTTFLVDERDGELQEGSNWEAIMFAGHKGLSNLTAIVDRNRLQQGARTEDTNRLDPLGDKWAAFGWEVCEIDGHDYNVLYESLAGPRGDRPRVVIANSLKGKGVSFMEDRVEWHHKVPSAEQFDLAKAELGAAK